MPRLYVRIINHHAFSHRDLLCFCITNLLLDNEQNARVPATKNQAICHLLGSPAPTASAEATYKNCPPSAGLFLPSPHRVTGQSFRQYSQRTQARCASRDVERAPGTENRSR